MKDVQTPLTVFGSDFSFLCLFSLLDRFLRQLLEADLSHNKIVTISNKAFSSQVNLKHLRLESNKISQVNNLTFYGLRQLEVISLRGNIIEALPDDLFEYCPKLKEIDLSQNRIADIQPTAFKGKKTDVDLSSCLIDSSSLHYVKVRRPVLTLLS